MVLLLIKINEKQKQNKKNFFMTFIVDYNYYPELH